MLATRLRDRGWLLSVRQVQRAYAKTAGSGHESAHIGENMRSTSDNRSQTLPEQKACQQDGRSSDDTRSELSSVQAQFNALERDLGFTASVVTSWVLWQLSDDLRQVVVDKVYGPSHRRAFTWTEYNKWLNNPEHSNKQQLPFAKTLMSPLCEPCDIQLMTWGLIRHTGKYNPQPMTPSAEDMAFAVWNTRTGRHIVSYEEALVILKILEQRKALELVLKGGLPSPIPF